MYFLKLENIKKMYFNWILRAAVTLTHKYMIHLNCYHYRRRAYCLTAVVKRIDKNASRMIFCFPSLFVSAARRRHKTMPSRTQNKISSQWRRRNFIANSTTNILWSLCHIYFQQWNFLAKSFAIWFVQTCRCQKRTVSSLFCLQILWCYPM